MGILYLRMRYMLALTLPMVIAVLSGYIPHRHRGHSGEIDTQISNLSADELKLLSTSFDGRILILEYYELLLETTAKRRYTTEIGPVCEAMCSYCHQEVEEGSESRESSTSASTENGELRILAKFLQIVTTPTPQSSCQAGCFLSKEPNVKHESRFTDTCLLCFMASEFC